MTKMSNLEAQVLGVIAQARGDTVTRRQICALTGLHDRSVRQIVRRLVRVHGLPIVSDGPGGYGGYAWASDPDRLLAAADRLVRHGLAILSRAAVLKRCNLADLLGQVRLEEHARAAE